MASLDARCLHDLAAARSREWLVANARGGFAMGTASGALARRYHGLLVAAPRTPAHRYLLLAKLEPIVRVGGQAFELGTNDYPGAVHPRGYLLLESFTTEPSPTWRWRAGGALVEQQVWMPTGSDTTVVCWRLIEGPAEVEIELAPLCTARYYHELTRRAVQGEPTVEAASGRVKVCWPGRTPTLHLSTNGRFTAAPDWYYDFWLTEETRRGYDDRQDLFRPGFIRATLSVGAGGVLCVAASAAAVDWRDYAVGRAVERSAAHRPVTREVPALPSDDRLLRRLWQASEPFVVRRGERGWTIIAGYPWFADWGRDAFISLPGLCLVTGRHDVARNILLTFAERIDQGMVPNRFSDVDGGAGGEPAEYNSVDASLWFIHAAGRYAAYAREEASLRRLFEASRDILHHFERGTRYGIGLREDGLLAAGEPGVQLTWMDAKVGDWVVTPRIGKPVEVNALWYNALQTAAELAVRLGAEADARHWRVLAERCRGAFNARYWNDSRGCLFDVVDVNHVAGSVDASLRPNQLFAVSLPHAVLDERRWQAVVDVVRTTLWTPLGLRTLARDDPAYRPAYAGVAATRDAAYHQGTAWPWLLGPMATATVRAGGGTAESRRAARALLSGLEAHLDEAGLDGVSEVADGEPPHAPGGCPWQAWSVAEPLRALAEDIVRAAGDRT